jgi:hypothetical protein
MSFCFFLSFFSSAPLFFSVLFLSQKSFAVFLISGIEDGGCRKASGRGRRERKGPKIHQSDLYQGSAVYRDTATAKTARGLNVSLPG